MSTYSNQIKSDLKKYGVHIIHVLAEDEEPGFSYTIGLYELHNKPELIMIGQEQDLHQVILNNMAYDYKEGRTLTNGNMEKDILDDYECLVIDVDKKNYEEYLGIAMDYYNGDDFPVMQIIWPTQSGMLPTDEDAPEGFKKWQPVLGNVKK